MCPDNAASRIVILMPVLDDWANVQVLLPRIDAVVRKAKALCEVVVVDDGTPAHRIPTSMLNASANITSIEIVRLVRNVGHQRAIAIGLSYAVRQKTFDGLIVMDSDGEDRPEDIERLLIERTTHTNSIIFASRAKRNESFIFKALYGAYKLLFRLLTGIPISFGNYCLIPRQYVKQLVCMPELWNHFAAGVIRSKIPRILLALERGTRIEGKSKMNFQSLVIHGLSAISVFIDTMAVRLLVGSLCLILVSIAAIFIVFGIKLFTELAIPGWASYLVLGFSSVLLQAVTLFFVLAFLVLSFRSQKSFVPYYDYEQLVDTIRKAE